MKLSQLTAAFLSPHIITAKTAYADHENAVTVKSTFIPALWYLFPPVTTFAFARRLFRDSLTQGSATWTYTPDWPGGILDLRLSSPKEFNFAFAGDYTDEADSSIFSGPGSINGFATGVQTWSSGITLASMDSSIKAEYSLFFSELSLRLKASAELGLRKAACIISAKWIGQQSAFGTGVGLSNEGVILRFQYVQYVWPRIISDTITLG